MTFKFVYCPRWLVMSFDFVDVHDFFISVHFSCQFSVQCSISLTVVLLDISLTFTSTIFPSDALDSTSWLLLLSAFPVITASGFANTTNEAWTSYVPDVLVYLRSTFRMMNWTQNNYLTPNGCYHTCISSLSFLFASAIRSASLNYGIGLSAVVPVFLEHIKKLVGDAIFNSWSYTVVSMFRHYDSVLLHALKSAKYKLCSMLTKLLYLKIRITILLTLLFVTYISNIVDLTLLLILSKNQQKASWVCLISNHNYRRWVC